LITEADGQRAFPPVIAKKNRFALPRFSFADSRAVANKACKTQPKAFWAQGARLCTAPETMLQRVLSNWPSSGRAELYSSPIRQTYTRLQPR